MPILSGETGHVPGTLGGVTFRPYDSDFAALANIVADTAVWSIRQNAVESDLTTAGVSGTRAGVLMRPVEWTVTMPEKVTARDGTGDEPEVVLTGEYDVLEAGKACTVWFRLGDNDCWHRITNSLITYAGPVCDATGDVIRWTVTGRGGRLVRYSAVSPAYDSTPEVIP